MRSVEVVSFFRMSQGRWKKCCSKSYKRNNSYNSCRAIQKLSMSRFRLFFSLPRRQSWRMTRFPPSVVKTSYVFEKLSELWDTMWRTWDLASALTRYYPGFGVSNNSGASTISDFRIRSLWAQLSVDKRTSGPFSLEKGNYLYRYYCVMDPICWCPEKQAAQCKRAVCTQWRGSAFCHRNVVSGEE